MTNEIEVKMIKTQQRQKTIYVLPDEYNHKGVRIEAILIDGKEIPRTMWSHFKNVRAVNIFSQLNDKPYNITAYIVDLS